MKKGSWSCINCNEVLDNDLSFCYKCGSNRDGSPNSYIETADLEISVNTGILTLETPVIEFSTNSDNEFKINHNDKFNDTYTSADIIQFIKENRIDSSTLIWNPEWGEWRELSQTEFGKIKNVDSKIKNVDSGLDEPILSYQFLAVILAPIAGVVMYFNNRKQYPNKAKNYLRISLISSAIFKIINLYMRSN